MSDEVHLEHTEPNKESPISPKSFKTEKGSIYTYDDSRKTTRFQVATGKTFPRQDLTVFVDLSPEENDKVLAAIQTNVPEKACVAKKGKDGSLTVIHDLKDVKDSDNLYLALAYPEKMQMMLLTKASLIPEVGKYVFDTRTHTNVEKPRTVSHLGHKVIEVNY